jgi:hypothetical protein
MRVSDDGRLLWILEAGDEIVVWATVDGMTTTDTSLCLITNTAKVCEPFGDGVMEPYVVRAGDSTPNPTRQGLDEQVFEPEVQVRVGGPDGEVALSEPISMLSQDGTYEPCAFQGSGDSLTLHHEHSTTCLWHTGADDVGTWTVTLDPFGDPTKPTSVFTTLRDHMPGNWCAASADGPGGISGRMKPGDQMSIQWTIPPDGICLRDGQGGTTSFGVGTAGTYVLVLEGDLTLTKVPLSP